MTAITVAAMVAGVMTVPDRPASPAIDHGGFIGHSPAEPAPPLTVIDGAGQPVDLSDFRGQVVLVNFWATWCAPCVREMPSLDRLQARLGGDDFQVVALSIDREGLEVVEPFYREHGLDNLGIYLDQELAGPRAFSVRGFPTSVLIDREGRRIATYEGDLEWDSDDVVEMLEGVIGI